MLMIQDDGGTDRGAENAACSDPMLRDLMLCYPLPAAASEVEIFSEVVEIRDVRVHAFGISTSTKALGPVTGAAADQRRAPRDRAYFELLERMAVTQVAARRESATVEDGVHGAPWRLSISNGVALHITRADSTRSAALEMVERDRVLRSWYGGARPEAIEYELGSWSTSLSEDYEIVVVRFWEGLDLPDERAVVAGIIAFPRVEHAPLSIGFAARVQLEDAVEAAGRELLQQIAFGWGEDIPSAPPEVCAGPEFNLDFFAYPAHHVLLRSWLGGAHEGLGPELPSAVGAIEFEDLTPCWLEGKLCVTKAIHPYAIPLVFGVGHPWFQKLPESMKVQPIG